MNENQYKVITENLNLYYGDNHALKDINMNIKLPGKEFCQTVDKKHDYKEHHRNAKCSGILCLCHA